MVLEPKMFELKIYMTHGLFPTHTLTFLHLSKAPLHPNENINETMNRQTKIQQTGVQSQLSSKSELFTGDTFTRAAFTRSYD